MQLRSSIQQQPKPPIVKVHQSLDAACRARKRQRRVLIVLALLMLLLYFLSIMPGVVQQLAAPAFFLSLFFLSAEVIVLVLFVRGPDRIQRLKGENQRRQLAAYAQYAESHEDNTLLPLVIPQPSADDTALPLPTIIQYLPRWQGLLLAMYPLLGIIILISILLLSLAYWATSIRFPLLYQILDFPTTITTIIAVFLIIGTPFIWIIVRSIAEKLEITEEGLTMTMYRGKSKKVHFISWSEARLLASEGYPGTRSHDHTATSFYELASEGEAVYWAATSERYRGIICDAQGQEIRPEEYQRMMQALLSVIVAKTNLPLYDLR
jgi:hypothetical protein